jgi:hypothetical protein
MPFSRYLRFAYYIDTMFLLALVVGGCGSGQKMKACECDVGLQGKPVVYSLAGGSMLIKPSMKYELAFSLHVLITAEDHHKLFVPWANAMRRDLSPVTLRQAEMLAKGAGDWQLGSLMAGYDGPDSIECICAYIQADKDGTIAEWAGGHGELCNKIGTKPERFASWYAGFMERYWNEGFGKQWEDEQKGIVYGDAEKMAREIEGLQPPLIEFLEKNTGRKFVGSTTVLFYPSSFSRPRHAYGFPEKDGNAVIYRVGSDKGNVIGSAMHELLHPLTRGWEDKPETRKAIETAATNKTLRESWEEKGSGSYDYPYGWFDEMMVHGYSNYLYWKLGMMSREDARRHVYCDYEAAMVDAMFDKYESIGNIDDFALYAIEHIQYKDGDRGGRFVFEEVKN